MRQVLFSIIATSSLCASIGCADILTGGAKSEDQDTGALIMALIGLSCNLGGQSFTPGPGVTCRVDFAQGTGTLFATANSRDEHALQIVYMLGTGGGLDILGAANPAAIGSGHGINITPTSVIFHGSSGSVEAAAAALIPAANVAGTVCIEIHTLESPVHLVADNGGCNPKQGASATSESTTITGARQGLGWGFSLSNATISGLTVYSSRIFSE